MRTLHVGLRIVDRARSVTFYTAVGFEVVGSVPETELGELTMLKLPEDEFVSLELVHQPDTGPVDPGGFSHLVIAVNDVHDTIGQLAAAGVEVEAPSASDGSDDLWTAWVTDPDGYRLELVQWPAGHPRGMTEDDLREPDDPMKREDDDVDQ
jgi:lactoylglutathione lyase